MSGTGERPDADHDGPSGREGAGEEAHSAAPDTPAAPADAGGSRDLRKVSEYFALLDFAAVPRSKAAWVVRAIALAVTLVVLWRRVDAVTKPLLSAKPPATIPTEEVDDYRFRIPERTRRAIFAELAAAELAERARAIQANTWKGHLWSREDDRGHHERLAARAAAAKHKVSLTQVYLVLDEGIRERWPGPDGNPLPATTPPLNIRSNSW
jgi:hypothetical protein